MFNSDLPGEGCSDTRTYILRFVKVDVGLAMIPTFLLVTNCNRKIYRIGPQNKKFPVCIQCVLLIFCMGRFLNIREFDYMFSV